MWLKTILSLLLILNVTAAEFQNCEVCIDAVAEIEFRTALTEKSSLSYIESKVNRVCRKDFPTQIAEVCKYIMPIKAKVIEGLSLGNSPTYICRNILYAHDARICAVHYPGNVLPISGVNRPRNLTYSQLVAFANNNGIQCKGCTRKRDYLNAVKDVFREKTKTVK